MFKLYKQGDRERVERVSWTSVYRSHPVDFASPLAISQIGFSVHDCVMVLLERNCAFADCQIVPLSIVESMRLFSSLNELYDGNCFTRDLNDIKIRISTKCWNFLFDTIIIDNKNRRALVVFISVKFYNL